ncbi:MbtH family protein [Actinomadura vinacea]|uniref:MbtH family protein n=1 Tax=Actinomadura vinacea TaxID=115336 RepID=A0ABN3K4K8_9ACTN
MTDPFDDTDGRFLVLVDGENQRSLCPEFADVPAGWTTVYGPEERERCLEYVGLHRSGLRPRSLSDR